MPTPSLYVRSLYRRFARGLRAFQPSRGRTAVAVALLLTAAVVPLGVWWHGTSSREAAAQRVYPPEAASLAQAAGEIDILALQEGVYRLTYAAMPTETPTPTTTPTATSTPPPTATRPPAPTVPPTPVPVQAVPSPTVPPPPPPPPQPPPASAAGCPTASMGGLALALFNAINSERTQRGVPALSSHGCVTYVAQQRAGDMASRGYFSHTSPEGATAFSMMDQYGVPYTFAGENLAYNTYPDGETVAVAISDMLNSPSHRDNMLRGDWTHLGVGTAVSAAGEKYHAMIFIRVP